MQPGVHDSIHKKPAIRQYPNQINPHRDSLLFYFTHFTLIMFSIAMYVRFLPTGRRRRSKKKGGKEKINEIKIVDKVKVKCPRVSHESICGCSLYIHS